MTILQENLFRAYFITTNSKQLFMGTETIRVGRVEGNVCHA